MPIFVEDDEGITLTLKNDQTITLKEKNLPRDVRQAIQKRLLTLGIMFETKQKRSDKLKEQIKSNGFDERQVEALAERAAEPIADIDLIGLSAEMFERRFESWDFYLTRADMEAENSVPMTQEAIISMCENQKRARIFLEIVDKLREFDAGEEKKGQPAPTDIGSDSIVIQH